MAWSHKTETNSTKG